MTCFSSDLFLYDKKTYTLTAEISELTEGGRTESTGVQFQIKSAHTGHVVTATLKQVVRDIEGDVVAWEYEVSANGAEYGGLKVVIFND